MLKFLPNKYTFFKSLGYITNDRHIKSSFFKFVLMSKYYKRKKLGYMPAKTRLENLYFDNLINYKIKLNSEFEKIVRIRVETSAGRPYPKLNPNLTLEKFLFVFTILKTKKVTYKKALKNFLVERPVHFRLFNLYNNYPDNRKCRRVHALKMAINDYEYVTRHSTILKNQKTNIMKFAKHYKSFSEILSRHDLHICYFYLPILKRKKDLVINFLSISNYTYGRHYPNKKKSKLLKNSYKNLTNDIKVSFLLHRKFGYYMPIYLYRRYFVKYYPYKTWFRRYRYKKKFWFLFFQGKTRLNKVSPILPVKSKNPLNISFKQPYRKSYLFSRQLKVSQLNKLFKSLLVSVYGTIKKKQLYRYIKKAQHKNGLIIEKFISLLEYRLDVALYRLNIANSVKEARKFIRRKYVLVNNKEITSYSHIISKTEIVSIKDKYLGRFRKKLFFEFLYGHPLLIQIPNHFEIDYSTLSFCIINKYLNLKKNYYREFKFIANVLFYEN